ncbi:MAG: type II toxin-antitoxin system Phd/YefM family antitoxin [Candidatus Omnitrophota bacterium]
MKFITIRDFRSNSARIQRELPKEREMILTSNGKPIAILSAVSEDNIEGAIATIRRARSIEAVTAMQTQSLKANKDKISLNEIDEEITVVRKKRKSR